eukprot:766586-Hanusia_phi.AAC.9
MLVRYRTEPRRRHPLPLPRRDGDRESPESAEDTIPSLPGWSQIMAAGQYRRYRRQASEQAQSHHYRTV